MPNTQESFLWTPEREARLQDVCNRTRDGAIEPCESMEDFLTRARERVLLEARRPYVSDDESTLQIMEDLDGRFSHWFYEVLGGCPGALPTRVVARINRYIEHSRSVGGHLLNNVWLHHSYYKYEGPLEPAHAFFLPQKIRTGDLTCMAFKRAYDEALELTGTRTEVDAAIREGQAGNDLFHTQVYRVSYPGFFHLVNQGWHIPMMVA